MRILIVNDDGILAPGLAALRSAVEDMGEVEVIAPDSPQSAAGRSITLHQPILCRRVKVNGQFWGVSVGGRPADCVKLAVRELLPARPDLVLSGINAGANVGVNVFYSGTVQAAAEGALCGIGSVAFSLSTSGEMDFQRAGRLSRWVLEGLLAAGLGAGELINVNIPDLSAGPLRGVKVVPQSTTAVAETYHRQEGQGQEMLFRLTDSYEHTPQDGETDVSALGEGFITVTPLQSDLTDRANLKRLADHFWGDLRRDLPH